MVRSSRHDGPGRRHHAMNRGVAKRVLFGERRMARLFLSRLASAARRGEIRVEAFALLHTHYHLMVRTDEGTLSYAMMRAQNSFSRGFNRVARRDGPLMRGRFYSKRVRGMRYFRTLVRYIDFNPVGARLCGDPGDYEYGSARLYMQRREGPLWLDRTRVEEYVKARLERERYDPADYRRVFGKRMSRDEIEIVERRLHRPSHPKSEELDDLLAAPPERVARWMRRKAALADGLEPWVPMAGTRAIRSAVAALASEDPELRLAVHKRRRLVWPVLEVGLLHALGGVRIAEIARRRNTAQSTATRMLQLHGEWLQREPIYQQLVGEASVRALCDTHD